MLKKICQLLYYTLPPYIIIIIIKLLIDKKINKLIVLRQLNYNTITNLKLLIKSIKSLTTYYIYMAHLQYKSLLAPSRAANKIINKHNKRKLEKSNNVNNFYSISNIVIKVNNNNMFNTITFKNCFNKIDMYNFALFNLNKETNFNKFDTDINKVYTEIIKRPGDIFGEGEILKGLITYKCELCNKVFKYYYNYLNHIKNKNPCIALNDFLKMWYDIEFQYIYSTYYFNKIKN